MSKKYNYKNSIDRVYSKYQSDSPNVIKAMLFYKEAMDILAVAIFDEDITTEDLDILSKYANNLEQKIY